MPRYTGASTINGFKQKSSFSQAFEVRNAIRNGSLKFTELTLQEGQRLDVLAGIYYGDSTLWWVLAAASGVGWGLQLPPGTLVRVPDFKQIQAIL